MLADQATSNTSSSTTGASRPARSGRLLYFNLALDKRDPILSFACRWADEFAACFEEVDIVTFRAGDYLPPPNTRVFTIGKHRSKMIRALTLIKLVHTLVSSRRYSVAFSHMNQIAVALAGPLLKFHRIPLGLWYAHRSVTLSLRAAALWSSVIFTSNKGGCRLRSDKVVPVGHGIDLDLFSPATDVADDVAMRSSESQRTAEKTRRPFKILAIGRIAPIKRLELIIDALSDIPSTTREDLSLELHFVGSPQGRSDDLYLQELFTRAAERGVAPRVFFCGSTERSQLPDLVRGAGCIINVTSTSSLDKSLLEGMACGVPVLGSSQYEGVLTPFGLGSWVVRQEAKSIASGIIRIAQLAPDARKQLGSELSAIIRKYHSLRPLVNRIVTSLEPPPSRLGN